MDEKNVIEISDVFNPIENIALYIAENSVPLFETLQDYPLKAIFDEKGFFLSGVAQIKYRKVRSEPHLYIAFVKNTNGTTYIGKSYQSGGRWKRSHAYHLGTLAHHMNNTIRYDDQNHSHWIDAWMNLDSIRRTGVNNTIDLKSEVLVVFIPFEIYSVNSYKGLTKEDIKALNHSVEGQLITEYSVRNVGLLNVQRKR